MRPKVIKQPAPQETPEQKEQREEAKRNNIATTQSYLRGQTERYRKMRGPTYSIASNFTAQGYPIVGGNVVRGNKYSPGLMG